MSQFTTNFRLELPNFNITGWHDAVNQNFTTLDTIISSGAGPVGITGLWDNDVAYVVGNRLIDIDDDSAWLCEVSHTSAVAGTFAADRAANPTFWSLLSLGLVIKGPWVVSENYLVGDVVYSVAEHIVAACIVGHTSVHLRNDATAGKWVFIADLKASVDAAASSATASASSATASAGSATAAAASAVSAASSAIAMSKPRNRIINGIMLYSQENGASAGTTNTYYAVDQWFTSFSTSTGVFTSVQANSPTPLGSQYRYRVTITTADTSLLTTEFVNIHQKMEGAAIADFCYGLATAKQGILRFGWKSPAGTYNVLLRNNANDRYYAKAFTITGGQANTDTQQTMVIPGDTTGTWQKDEFTGMELIFLIANGNTGAVTGWNAGSAKPIAGLTNGAATGGAVFELFDVGWYIDVDNGGVTPPWEVEDLTLGVLRCQRYYQKITTLMAGNVTSGQTYSGFTQYRTMMRIAAPILTGTNSANVAFPTTVGVLVSFNSGVQETRTANATGPSVFRTVVEVDARM